MSTPELTNDGILLRPLVLEDSPALLALRSNPIVNKFIDRVPFSRIEDSYSFINKIQRGIQDGQWHYWAISLSEHPHQLIGTICLWNFSTNGTEAEVGYELDPDYHGQGIMSKSLSMVVQYSLTENICSTITAQTFSENIKSQQLLLRTGFQKQGISEENPDMLIYAMSRYRIINAHRSGS